MNRIKKKASDNEIKSAINQSYTFRAAARLLGKISVQALYKRAIKMEGLRFANGALCSIKTRTK